MNVVKMLGRFLGREQGATTLEYALIVALVAMAAIGAVTVLGVGVTFFFDAGAKALP